MLHTFRTSVHGDGRCELVVTISWDPGERPSKDSPGYAGYGEIVDCRRAHNGRQFILSQSEEDDIIRDWLDSQPRMTEREARWDHEADLADVRRSSGETQ